MLNELRDRLFERIDGQPNKSVLALLDPNHPVAPHHPLHLDRLAVRPLPSELVTVPREDLADPLLHPRLLVLRRPEDRGYPDEALLDLTLQCATERRTSINGAYVCGWLVTDEPASRIASQIRRYSVMRDPLLRKQRVLPVFEPHRMVLASHLAPSQWLGEWLGAISSWFLIDACGQLKEIRPTVRDASELLKLPNEAFWRAQGHVRRAREVLLTLVKAGHMVPVDCEIRIEQALLLAEAQGIRDIEDLLFFATNHLVLPPYWHEHPAIQDCLEKAKSGAMPLTDSIAALPDDVLDELSLMDASGSALQRQRRT